MAATMCESSLGVETTRRFQPPPAKGIIHRMFANGMVRPRSCPASD